MIADYVEPWPWEYTLLRLSSSVCYTGLRKPKPKSLWETERLLVTSYCTLDWNYHPQYQECIVCYNPHLRLFVQPWSNSVLNRQYADCTGGLRISADRMLCGSCCDYMLEDRKHFIRVQLINLGFDNGWTHKWHTQWQNGRVIVSVHSRRGMADLRGLRSMIDKYTAFWTLPIGLGWCGCTDIRRALFLTVHIKIESFLRHPAWISLRWNKSRLICQDCGTLYVVGIVKEKEVKVLHVSRSSSIGKDQQQGSSLVTALKRTATALLTGSKKVASITRNTASK